MSRRFELIALSHHWIDQARRCIEGVAAFEREQLLVDDLWMQQKANNREGVVAIESGKVCAFAAWDAFPSEKLVEMRSCVVSAHARGNNLQLALHGMRGVLLSERNFAYDNAFSVVKASNIRSIDNLKAIGFERWWRPYGSLAGLCKQCGAAERAETAFDDPSVAWWPKQFGTGRCAAAGSCSDGS